MNDKLGWVRTFREDLASWSRCEQVMQASLKFINQQGVYRGAAANLNEIFDGLESEHSQTAPGPSVRGRRLEQVTPFRFRTTARGQQVPMAPLACHPQLERRGRLRRWQQQQPVPDHPDPRVALSE